MRLVDVTGVPHQYGDFPMGTRAVTLFDPLTPSVEPGYSGSLFARRELRGVASLRAVGGLTRKLHLMNGRLVNHKIRSEKSSLSKLLDSELPYEQIVSKLYLACFSRYPMDTERQYWQQQEKQVKTDQQRRELLEDLFWSLLACREFTNESLRIAAGELVGLEFQAGEHHPRGSDEDHVETVKKSAQPVSTV